VYTPSFNVHIMDTIETITSTADLSTESIVKVFCNAKYDSGSSIATLEANFDREITIEIDVGIPEMDDLHSTVQALGQYTEVKVLNSAFSHVANETGIEDGYYIDYTGSLECETTIDGEATGGGSIVWDSMESVYLTITHAPDVTSGDTFRILLHDFYYVVDLRIYYEYESGTETDIFIDVVDVRTGYVLTPTTITTVTYTPGFGLIVTASVLSLLGLGLIIIRHKRKLNE